MKMRIIFSLLLLVFTFGNANAQCKKYGWTWPADADMESQAKAYNALYNDSRKMKDYEGAVGGLNWLLKNTPDLNPSIYINGVKIYSALEKKEKDVTRKKVLRDSVLLLFDLRMKHFDCEATVLNRKVSKAFFYHKKDKSKYPELLAMYKKVLALNGAKTSDNNTVGYFDTVKRFKESGGTISDDEVLEIYDTIIDVLEQKIDGGADEVKIKSYISTIDGMLSSIIKVDCEFIKNKLGPKFDADPSNVKIAKSILGHSLKAKCLDLPVVMRAAEKVVATNPDYGVYIFLAGKSKQNKDFSKAIAFYGKAAELAKTNAKKADAHIQIGNVKRAQGNKPGARASFRKAISLGKNSAYANIGDLYMGSFKQCAGLESKVKDRGVFLAAYKMYKKAGNSSKMARAKAQFPSSEEIFTEGMAVGQNISVGCWVGETVTLQKR